jgi:hypothetical protein
MAYIVTSNHAAASCNERKDIMKYTKMVILAGAMVGLVGCASAPRVVVLDPVGPAPTGGSPGRGQGSLVVYSARVFAAVDVNEGAWREMYDFDNSESLYLPAHTDYTIHALNGEVIKRVRNARSQDDDTPTVVTLPAGSYRIEAKGINCDGSRIGLLVPVVVRSGQTTVANLEGGWRPPGEYKPTEVAKLPCGKIIGWRATERPLASHQAAL